MEYYKKRLTLVQYVRLYDGFFKWASYGFPRAFALMPNSTWYVAKNARKLGLPNNCIVTTSNNEKLLAHEFGHLIELKHPKCNFKAPKVIFNIVAAHKAGYPIMSAYGFLRLTDEIKLVEQYRQANIKVV